jgi:hypothetical protein
VFEKSPTVVSRQVAGEVILVPVVRSQTSEAALYTLDEVAAFLWEKLDGRTSGEELIGKLLESYEAPPKEARKDVETFLADLKEIEAIRGAAAPVA